MIFFQNADMSTKCDHACSYNHTNSVMLAESINIPLVLLCIDTIAGSCISYAYACILKNIVEQVEKSFLQNEW